MVCTSLIFYFNAEKSQEWLFLGGVGRAFAAPPQVPSPPPGTAGRAPGAWKKRKQKDWE